MSFDKNSNFNKLANFTEVTFGESKPVLEVELNELQQIQNEARADIIRETIPSGFTVLGDLDFDYMKANENVVKLKTKAVAFVNGWRIEIPEGTTIDIGKAPEKASRYDLLFLEVWKERVTFEAKLTKNGGEGQIEIDNKIKDTRYPLETTRREVLRWRIRHVADVDFDKYVEGISSNPNVTGQGSLITPQPNHINFAFIRQASDIGLWRTDSNKSYKTVDDCVYAVPMFKLFRKPSCGKLYPFEYQKINSGGNKTAFNELVSKEKVERINNFKIEGQTFNNLTKVDNKVYPLLVSGSNGTIRIRAFNINRQLELGKEYTVIVNIQNYKLIGSPEVDATIIKFYRGHSKQIYNPEVPDNKSNGIKKFKFTATSDDIGDNFRFAFYLQGPNVADYCTFEIATLPIFLEGDYTNVDVPLNLPSGLSSTFEDKYDATSGKYLVTVKSVKDSFIGGVRFSKTNPNSEGERLGDAINKTAKAGVGSETVLNDFDNMYPWNARRKCNISSTGQILAYEGDANFRYDGTNGDVMVETPVFYQKYVETDEYVEYWISKHKAPGFRVSPAFKTASGKIIPKIYTGAYKANMNNTNNALESVSGKFPRVEAGRHTFRDLAKAKGSDWGITDIAYRCDILNYLFYIEFATRNSQAIMQGLTTFQWDYTTTAETVGGNTLTLNSTNIAIGFTLRVANIDRRVTAINGSTVTVDGDPFTVASGIVISSRGWINGACDNIKATSGSVISNTDGKSCCIYRGEENPWGNIWEWVDGCNIQDRQAYVCSNPEDYSDDKFTAPYIATSYTNASTDGYVVTMGNDESNPYVQLPIGVGGSSSTYFADYYYQNSGNRALRVGATLDNGSSAGLSCWLCVSAFSNSARTLGARLSYKPSTGADEESINPGIPGWGQSTTTLQLSEPLYANDDLKWKRKKRVTFNGSESISLNTIQPTDVNFISFILATNLTDATTNDNKVWSICDKFIVLPNFITTDDSTTEYITLRPGASTVRFIISKTKATDLETFKTWLSQNPVTIEYELANPIPRTNSKENIPNVNLVQYDNGLYGDGGLYIGEGINHISCEGIPPSKAEFFTPYRILGEGMNEVLDCRYKRQNDGYEPTKVPLGKNLFDKSNVVEIGGSGVTSTTVGGTIVASSVGDTNHRSVVLKLPVGKTYTVYVDKTLSQPINWVNSVLESYSNSITVGGSYTTLARAMQSTSSPYITTFTTTKPYVIVHIGIKDNFDSNPGSKEALLNSLQIEQGTISTSYEPYIYGEKAFENTEENDIESLQHKVSLTGFNYPKLLQDNFNKLLNGDI